MKPLSNDLREKFVHAVLIEGMTCRAAGERFAVSHSAVIKIVRQFVETDAICSGAQSKCGRRAIEGHFGRRLAETEGTLWRTLFETERTLFETDARS